MRNRILLLIYLATLVAGTGLVLFTIRQPDSSNLPKAMPIIAAMFVSVGWVVTALMTNWNNQREHTIEMITNSKDENAKKWETIKRYLPGEAELPLPGEPPLTLGKDDEFYKKVVERLLDDFDFISLGTFKGVYDEHMLYSALGNDFLDLYSMTKRYIRYVQVEDKDDQVWREFARLCLQWGASCPPPPPVSRVRRAWKFAFWSTKEYVVAGYRWLDPPGDESVPFPFENHR
jgi:hypothetical protein